MDNGVVSNEKAFSPPRAVGVLIDSVDSYFNHRVIMDLIDAADEQGLHLIFYLGGFLEKHKTAGVHSFVYTLPNPDTIDALIIFPHSVSPYSPRSTMQIVLEQYKNLPIYSFNVDLPTVFSVYTNENAAIESMIRHLVDFHHFKQFALLCGPDSSESISRERQVTIQRVLETCGITLDESRIFPGTFSMEDGKNTAEKILALEGDSPEVLICMNDQMAIGAIREFMNNGISVPEDIAVVGFDDVEENSILSCSFTTINFPVWEMIGTIMERVHSDLSGITAYSTQKIELPAQFMHRESCGCTSYYEQKIKTESTFSPLEEKRSSHGSLKRAAILRRSLEDVVEECIAKNDPAPFNEFIHEAIRTLSRSGDLTNSFIDTFSTQWTVTLLRHQDFSTQVLINGLFVDAFRLLVQIRMKAFSRVHQNDLGSLTFYHSCNNLLSQKISLIDAIKGIRSNLPQLGIARCLLVFICQDDPEMAELRLSYREDFFSEIPTKDFIRFPIKQLVNTGVHSIHNPMAVLTIEYNKRIYGYLVLSITDKRFEQFSMIQDLISHIIDSAMMNDLLSTHIRTLTQKNDVLSRLSVIDEFTGLYNRRALYVTGKNMYQQAMDNRETSCFIFVDMDGLKKINDAYGHKDGDAAILALSNTLKQSFREKDLVVRYGGDEFVIVMANIQEKALHKALARIKAEIDSFNAQEKHPWKLSASWGYVFNDADSEPKSFESVIEESDAKLYQEKRDKRTAAT